MDARHWTDGLVSIGACSDAVDWARQYDSLQSAWDACERGNWMMWLWARVDAGAPWSDARRPLVLAACECARLAMAYVAQGATCPLVAIETAESWARGEHNDIDRLLAAANAAYAAANAANAAYAAAYAAYAAARKKCADIVRKHRPKAPELKGDPE